MCIQSKDLVEALENFGASLAHLHVKLRHITRDNIRVTAHEDAAPIVCFMPKTD